MNWLVQDATLADPVSPAVGSTPFTTAFDELAKTAIDTWNVPGISIAVVDGDSTFSKVSREN